MDRGYDYQTKADHIKLHMSINPPLLLLAGALLLTGCDRDRTSGLCTRFPQFCADLHGDSWCNAERDALVQARYERAGAAGDAGRYRLMSSLEDYRQCLDPLLDIEYTKRHERKNDKVETLVDITEELERLEAQTADSDYPYLQLWRWQRHGDRAARNAFIAQAERPAMQQADLQLALARLVRHRDPEATEQALHRALALLPAGEQPPADLMGTLVELYVSQQRYQEAWIWTTIMKELKDSQQVDWGQMASHVRFDEDQQARLRQQADAIVRQLQQGRYQHGGAAY